MSWNTCSEVEHVEVRGEVVSDVSSGQMVEVRFMEKHPTIPDQTTKGAVVRPSCTFYVQKEEIC